MEQIIYDVLKKIEDNDFKAYLVGGYVRDYLMNNETFDIDICTNARPKELKEIFNDEFVTSFDYGNVFIKKGHYDITVTTFRKDIIYINNRKPDIIYVDSLEDDLLRRDFTCNAICMDIDGNIVDLLDGVIDINNKIIKAVGDPYKKLEEDILRIMRAIRFATVLDFKIDDELKLAIKKHKHLLKNLSYTRKKEELSKIFTSNNKEYGIFLLKELDLLEELDLINIDNVLFTNDLIGIWATITKDDTYSFRKNEKKLIEDINKLLELDLNDNYVLYKYGTYLVSIVCDLKKINKDEILNRLSNLVVKDKNEIDIDVNDIAKCLNKEPGAYIKDIFLDLEISILNNKLNNSRVDIIKYIKDKYML